MGVPIKNVKLDLYTSIEDMILYNFDRYLATHDLNWFRKDYTGRESKIDSPELKATEERILDEYFTAIDDRSFQGKLQKWFQISELTKVYNVVQGICTVIIAGFEDTEEELSVRHRLITCLNKGYGSIKFNVPIFNSTAGDIEEMQKVMNQSESIKVKIALIRSDLKDEGQKDQRNLYKQLRIVANALGQKEISNPKTITVAQWIADCQLMGEIAKQN